MRDGVSAKKQVLALDDGTALTALQTAVVGQGSDRLNPHGTARHCTARGALKQWPVVASAAFTFTTDGWLMANGAGAGGRCSAARLLPWRPHWAFSAPTALDCPKLRPGQRGGCASGLMGGRKRSVTHGLHPRSATAGGHALNTQSASVGLHTKGTMHLSRRHKPRQNSGLPRASCHLFSAATASMDVFAVLRRTTSAATQPSFAAIGSF